ncbi:MAG: divalent-cation tolerance protein CutA [bacterium]
MAEVGDHAVVFITASSPAEGTRIADALVHEKLAACVNQVPGVVSTYWWQGKVERATEVLLIAKTGRPLVEPLIARVKELHSYAVPEVIALRIEHGNPDYLKWIDEVTG